MKVKRWKVTFHYNPPILNGLTQESHWVDAPNKRFALWAGREAATGVWVIPHPHCVKETVSICRK